MRTATIVATLLLFSTSVAYAQDAKPEPPAKVEVKADVKAEPKVPAEPEVALPKDTPKDAGEAFMKVQEGIEFAKAKNWWGLSAVIIFVLMFLLKMFGLFKKIGKRWGYIVVGVLSMAAMLLAKFSGDLSWGAAIAVLTSGPFMAYASDLVKRGIMGKEHVTPVVASNGDNE